MEMEVDSEGEEVCEKDVKEISHEEMLYSIYV